MDKKASLRAVARAANVSAATVSNYLNNRVPVHPDTQRRIQEAMDELGYVREPANGRAERTRTLGMIVPSVNNPFYTAVFMGAEEAAHEHGYTITLGATKYDHTKIKKYLDVFQSKQMDGIIIEGSATYLTEHLPHTAELPVVVIEPPGVTPWSSVQIDNTRATREIVEHLIDLGHERIAAITVNKYDVRLAGYLLTMQARGIPIDPTLIYHVGLYGDDIIAQGRAAMRELLARADFTACYCNNDLLAIGALTEAKAQGIRIPGDIAITGFDDIPLASLIDPPLTTISQPMEAMGRAAVEIVLRQIHQENTRDAAHVILDHALVIRESTRGTR